MRVVLTVFTYTVLSPFGYLIFALIVHSGTRDRLRRARRLQRVTAFAYRFMHDWLRLVGITRFNHRDGLPGLPDGPCVVVANHPTLMDITSITAVLGGGCTVVKQELYHRRMLHPLLLGAGHVEGPGPDPTAAGRVIAEAVEWLHRGFPMIIFPEGTRSPAGRLLPFGRAAFEIACRARVPVVSVGIRCEPVWLSKEVPLFQPPHPIPELGLQILATDEPARVGFDSRVLRRHVEQRYREWFAAGRVAVPEGLPDPPDSNVPTVPSASDASAVKDFPCPTSKTNSSKSS